MKRLLKIVIGIAVAFVAAIALVFYLTTGIADTAGKFFAAIKKQDIATARSFLSEDFKASTDEAALRDFLTKGALLNFKDTSWSRRQISGGRGELEGEVITETGGVVPLTLLFVKEKGDWKIYGIQKATAGLQTEQTTPNVPSKPDQVALVKRSMYDFGVAVNTRDMKHFHGTVSQIWQHQYTPEKFTEVFGKMFDKGVDFTMLERIEPVIDPVTSLGENGELILKGHFPTEPSQVKFEQSYIYEGLGWKLFGFQFNITHEK